MGELALSKLALSVKPSATLAAGARAKAMKASGIAVFDFTLGEPDFPTPSHICDAARKSFETGQVKYTAAEGSPPLRNAVAQWYKSRYGLNYAENQVVISNGAKQNIFNALGALIGPGDEVILPAPYWTSYVDIIQMVGAIPKIIDCPASTSFRLKPEQLSQAITKNTKVLLLNSPSNPTGSVYSHAELNALAEVVRGSHLAVISDEIYECLTFGSAKAHCFASLHPDLYDRTIVVSGVSKTWAMTGWRIGWAVGPAHVIKAIGSLQSQESGSPGTVSQAAALAALTGDQACVETMRQQFAKRRDIVVSGLNAIPGIKIIEPEGAFYAFFDVTAHLGKTVAGVKLNTSADFCQVALEKAHVSTVPGSAFGAEGFVRMSFATSEEQIRGGIEALKKLLA